MGQQRYRFMKQETKLLLLRVFSQSAQLVKYEMFMNMEHYRPVFTIQFGNEAIAQWHFEVVWCNGRRCQSCTSA